jgi:hypothetical protein
MSANHDNDDDSGTAFTVAAIGGGAVLLWLVLRGRGTGWRGSGNGASTSGGQELPAPRRAIAVFVRAGDRVDVDGVATDLATTVTLAQAAGAARLSATGDARAGWLSKVYYALMDGGVEIGLDEKITEPLIRPADQKTPNGSTNPQPYPHPTVDPAIPVAALDNARASISAQRSLRGARAFLADVRNASKYSSSQSCPPRPSGGGALVRSAYRVAPFLAEDVLLVEDDWRDTNGRVYCVAYDVSWKERIFERKGWLDRDSLSPILEPGMRAELSPVCPLWIGGAKHGTVQQVTKDWTVVVKMDEPRVRRLQRFTDHTQLTVRESLPENE